MRIFAVVAVGLLAVSVVVGCNNNKPIDQQGPIVTAPPAGPEVPAVTDLPPIGVCPPNGGGDTIETLPPLPPTPPQPPVASGARTYTVKPGDGLMKIAREQLGNQSRYKEIAELNNIQSPYLIKAGQVLKLPAQ